MVSSYDFKALNKTFNKTLNQTLNKTLNKTLDKTDIVISVLSNVLLSGFWSDNYQMNVAYDNNKSYDLISYIGFNFDRKSHL